MTICGVEPPISHRDVATSMRMASDIQEQVPDDTETQEAIRVMVRFLLSETGVKKGELARAINMGPSSLSRSLGSDGRLRAWGAGEVYRVARFFNVPVGALYGEPAAVEAVMEQFVERATERRRAWLETIAQTQQPA